MGPLLFDYGYGPFRWVCLSGKPEDLRKTDRAAMACIDPHAPLSGPGQLRLDPRRREEPARGGHPGAHPLPGRRGPHADRPQVQRDGAARARSARSCSAATTTTPGGTDSPFRETANIKDGCNIMADMATQCFAGNAARGMSLVALHNGGGVGIGKAINGGFGLVLDGSQRVDEIIRRAMPWDVMGGVARRAWARNDASIETCIEYNRTRGGLDHVTLPYLADEGLVGELVSREFDK